MINIAIISLAVIVLAICINIFLVEKKKGKRIEATLTAIMGISGSFLGITLGLYFAELENKRIDRQNTYKYLEIGLQDVELVQSMLYSRYLDEFGKYYGKHIEGDSVLHVGILRRSEIPFPYALETILTSDIFPKHLPNRLYNQLNICYHNSKNFKKLIETHIADTSKTNDQQLLYDVKAYLTILSFNYYAIQTELNFENGEITNLEAETKYHQGWKRVKSVMTSKDLNKILDKELKLLEFSVE